jgi:cyclic pyranopterin phosphate synthase
MTGQEFSHLDGDGKLQMVDISAKELTQRVAHASCLVVARAGAHARATRELGGDVILSARLAGIQAAKRTADLIPLCHPLALTKVGLDIVAHPRGYAVSSVVATRGRTGVEMEALTACSFAALTLVASLVGVEPRVRVEDVALLKKSGGKSGDWGRDVVDAE